MCVSYYPTGANSIEKLCHFVTFFGIRIKNAVFAVTTWFSTYHCQ